MCLSHTYGPAKVWNACSRRPTGTLSAHARRENVHFYKYGTSDLYLMLFVLCEG
jgi:hypothetical protein